MLIVVPHDHSAKTDTETWPPCIGVSAPSAQECPSYSVGELWNSLHHAFEKICSGLLLVTTYVQLRVCITRVYLQLRMSNAVHSPAFTDQSGPSSRGTDFYVAFLANVRSSAPPPLQLLVTTDEPEPVTFTVSLNEDLPGDLREGFPLTATVSYGEVVTVSVHPDFRYINLAISSTFFDNSIAAQDEVRINGTAVTPNDGWLPMYCSNNEVCGYGAQVEVSSGTMRVYHERPEVGLGLHYYAYQHAAELLCSASRI